MFPAVGDGRVRVAEGDSVAVAAGGRVVFEVAGGFVAGKVVALWVGSVRGVADEWLAEGSINAGSGLVASIPALCGSSVFMLDLSRNISSKKPRTSERIV